MRRKAEDFPQDEVGYTFPQPLDYSTNDYPTIKLTN
jgi:hypothetical protein